MDQKELIDFLRANKIWAKKSMGQNFLVDPIALNKIVDAANLDKHDTVVEIGPGLGILTTELLKKVAKVLAIEKDDKFAEALRLQFSNSNVEVLHQDALSFDPIKIKDYKIVANIPYNITSLIIRKFLEAENKPEMLVLMVQKEVAERIIAKEGEMSLLSVSVQFYAEPQIIDIIKNDCFYPQPKVDSAIIRLKVRKNFPIVDEEKFFRLIKFGFAARRKTLENNLSAGLHIIKDKASDIIRKVGFDEKIRAEKLSIDDWLKLYRIIFGEESGRKEKN